MEARQHPVSGTSVLLSFGDMSPLAARNWDTGSILICQGQTLREAFEVLENGAYIIVAEGAEVGGLEGERAALPLIPVGAAGGVAGRLGLAAALMPDAEAAMIATRFCGRRRRHLVMETRMCQS